VTKQAGAAPNLRFVANNAAASASFLRIGGKAVEGTLIGTDAFPEIRTDALAKTFVANYQKKYNAIPDQWNAVGYTIGKLYGHALANVKGAVTRQSLNDAVIATRNFPVVLGSGKGNFSFAGSEREPTYEPILITVKDGKFIPAQLPCWRSSRHRPGTPSWCCRQRCAPRVRRPTPWPWSRRTLRRCVAVMRY